MSLKRSPTLLYNMCLRQVAKVLLQSWEESCQSKNSVYYDQIRSNICVLIPFSIYNKIFELMIDIHGRVIQHLPEDHNVPTITSLIDTMIVPNLLQLNLNCLRHIGCVNEEEIAYLENLLTTELPHLNNLVELSLQTSGTESTLPTCNNEMLEIISQSCQNLKSLDISYNHTVTDEGIICLIPRKSQKGCPLLNKLYLFECSVTNDGVTMILAHLSELKFLGFKETGQCLLLLNRSRRVPSNSFKTLELAHVNNLGIISRTCKDVYKLRCNEDMVNAICMFCPNLQGLKVRVEDSDLSYLEKISSVTMLELVYNIVVPSPPGINTVQYLNNNGSQLISLSFVCSVFTTQYLKLVCEQCPNLKRLMIRSNQFICDQDLLTSDKKCSLSNLEVFSFNVSCSVFYECHIPRNVIHYVLHKSNSLKELVLAMRNSEFDDTYVQELFLSIDTSKLKHILIFVPDKHVRNTSLNLSMASVNGLIRICPQLEKLGNLLVWDVSQEEVKELRRQLKISNCALVLVYKMMYTYKATGVFN